MIFYIKSSKTNLTGSNKTNPLGGNIGPPPGLMLTESSGLIGLIKYFH